MPELAKEMSEESGFTIKAAKEFIRTLSVLLRRHMAHGDTVQIKGIGKFFSYQRYPHQRYSFQDESMVDYAPRMIPKFLFSESFVEYFREHFGQEEDSKIGDEEEYDAEEQI
jgi:nucleoid DNA-binding protein